MREAGAPDRPRVLRHAALAAGFILAAVGGFGILMDSDSQSASAPAAQPAADKPVQVETRRVTRETVQTVVVVWGAVTAARELDLTPEIDGRVAWVSDALEAGGRVARGDPLVRLDPRARKIEVDRAEAAVAQARASLEQELSRRDAARAESQDLLDELPEKARDRVLRGPQVRAARAGLASARADLARARLEASNAEIRAPFDAVVLSRSADTGEQVAPGQALARLAGRKAFHITASMSPEDRQLLAGRADGLAGAPVEVSAPDAWGGDSTRQARVVRVLPGVSPEGRLPRVLVAVDAPLAGEPAVRLDAFVRLAIDGPRFEGAVRLPQRALRADESVWVMTPENELEIRAVRVVRERAGTVVVEAGLADGDRVVVSSIADPVPGMPLSRDSDGGR